MSLHEVMPARRVSSFQLIIAGFALVILTGSFLLMLPVSTQDGLGASFSDALFTSTSAVCVTGLVVHDTATYWSLFGQGVILMLIQIGGMGVVTVSVSLALISGKKISLLTRSTMQEAISAPQIGGIVRLTGFIIKTMVMIELLGTIALSFVFCKDFGFIKGIWCSIFHSVSAFCNAGFDLMGVREQYSSLVTYSNNAIVCITISLLIAVGGIGFLTWDDIKVHRAKFKRYRMQSKVIITTTAFLILGGAAYFFFFEFGDMPFRERLLASWFQSITPRTAGFNTVDLTAISETGCFLMVILMLTGGSPGSTAGGMKTTTAAVLFSTAFSVFTRKSDTHFYGRRVTDSTVRNAATIFLMYITLCFSSAMIISSVESVPMLTALFETSSAIGTVGLTLGITTQVGLVSRSILIGLMFFGRVGGLTLIFAALNEKAATGMKYPHEKLTVG